MKSYLVKTNNDSRAVRVLKSTADRLEREYIENNGNWPIPNKIALVRDYAIRKLFGRRAFLWVDRGVEHGSCYWYGQVCKRVSFNSNTCITPRIYVELLAPA